MYQDNVNTPFVWPQNTQAVPNMMMSESYSYSTPSSTSLGDHLLSHTYYPMNESRSMVKEDTWSPMVSSPAASLSLHPTHHLSYPGSECSKSSHSPDMESVHGILSPTSDGSLPYSSSSSSNSSQSSPTCCSTPSPSMSSSPYLHEYYHPWSSHALDHQHHHPHQSQHALRTFTDLGTLSSLEQFHQQHSDNSKHPAMTSSLPPCSCTPSSVDPTVNTSCHYLQPAAVAIPPHLTQQSTPSTVMSDIRPYPCYMCHRAFARKHDLQRHIRVHTGAKPYVCPCCKKAFARTDALKRHLRMEEACRLSPAVQAMKTSGMRSYRNL